MEAELADDAEQALATVDEGGGRGVEDGLLGEGARVEEGVGEGGGGERGGMEGGGAVGVGVVVGAVDLLQLADDGGGG